MKLVLLIAVFSLLLITGCSEVNINIPEAPQSNTYSLIKIFSGTPEFKPENRISYSKEIDGSAGGNISFQETYNGPQGGKITVTLNMDIPRGAFDGIQTITLTVDDKYAALYCEPSMVFNKNLFLDFSYLGLDLRNILKSKFKVNFGYITDNGLFRPIKHNGVKINTTLGLLDVKNAKLDHFSRYGWGTRNMIPDMD